jgi:hypothetical protein
VVVEAAVAVKVVTPMVQQAALALSLSKYLTT